MKSLTYPNLSKLLYLYSTSAIFEPDPQVYIIYTKRDPMKSYPRKNSRKSGQKNKKQGSNAQMPVFIFMNALYKKKIMVS